MLRTSSRNRVHPQPSPQCEMERRIQSSLRSEEEEEEGEEEEGEEEEEVAEAARAGQRCRIGIHTLHVCERWHCCRKMAPDDSR
jgi:hypothetical protein